MIGEPFVRNEDARLVTGNGLYVDDVRLPGMLFVAFVRSPYAHAKVVRVDKTQAVAIAGVVAVICPGDIPALDEALPELIGAGTLKNPYVDHFRVPPQTLLPRKVSYVGEQVAVVVARSPYVAADAVNLVEVEYEQLPIAAKWDQSIDPKTPRIHEGYDNIVAHLRWEVGSVEAPLSEAEVLIEERFETQSLKSMAIECRACAAQWEAATATLNVWSTCHLFYMVRDALARILKLPYEQVRIISRDTGGSFGLKGVLYPEDLIIPILAQHLGAPLRWSETRSEHMTASNHSGVQVHDVRVAATKTGKITALDAKLYKDVGAYNHFEMVLLSNTINHLPAHYKIPTMRFEGWALATNTSPGSPYRGAGRIEGSFTMDRILDAIARATGVDPLDVRLRNIVTPADMPYRNGLIYRDGVEIVHENADFPLMLRSAAERVDYEGWRRKQRDRRKTDRPIGIGISSYVEAGGIGPSEGATIKIDDTGLVSVALGVNTAGQSHETTMAQVCAQQLGVPFKDVKVRVGDTSLQRVGFGTGASRVGVASSNAVDMASRAVRRKAAFLASKIFDCLEGDVQIEDGIASIRGPRQEFMSLGALAAAAWRHPAMNEIGGPGLVATEFFYPRTVVWSSGVNIAVVEVDLHSGEVVFLKYVVVHDCGTPLNVMIVEGQVIGGFTQGFGIALGEETLYDSDAQPGSGSMMDYYVPRAIDVPKIDLHHYVFKSSNNALGVKSVGESGPISPPAAISAAIEDALDGRLKVNRLPVTKGAILSAIRQRARESNEVGA